MSILLSASISDDLFRDFLNEFEEAYHFCEVKLVELEETPEDEELIRQLFRSVHTIKGNLSFVELGVLIPILQAVEDLLAELREKKLIFNSAISDVVLLSIDKVKSIVYDLEVHHCSPASPSDLKEAQRLIHAITEHSGDAQLKACNRAILFLDPLAEIIDTASTKKESSTTLPVQRLDDEVAYLLAEYDIDVNEDIYFFLDLMKPIERRSSYWSGRSTRLLKLALAMNALADSPVDAGQLTAAVLMHDISMAFLPLDLLHRSTPFNHQEKATVQNHASSCFELLSNMKNWDQAALIVYQHHERADGTGYPLGLIDKQICDGAKILAIVDTFDAITHQRAHTEKVKRPFIRAVLEINSQSGSLFSPYWVEHFNTIARNQNIA